MSVNGNGLRRSDRTAYQMFSGSRSAARFRRSVEQQRALVADYRAAAADPACRDHALGRYALAGAVRELRLRETNLRDVERRKRHAVRRHDEALRADRARRPASVQRACRARGTLGRSRPRARRARRPARRAASSSATASADPGGDSRAALVFGEEASR